MTHSTESAELTAEMKGLASQAVTFAAQYGLKLDYSESSLDQVDQFLDSYTNDDVITPSSPDHEQHLWSISLLFGAYVGEVVVNELGGYWGEEDLGGGGVRPVLTALEIQCFPAEKVWKRITEDIYSAVGGYCRALRAISQHLKQGRDSGDSGESS